MMYLYGATKIIDNNVELCVQKRYKPIQSKAFSREKTKEVRLTKNMNNAEIRAKQLFKVNEDLKTTTKHVSNIIGKKEKKKRNELVIPDFPMRVPTIFRFNINKRADEDNYLYIESNVACCCVCSKFYPPNKMQHIITGFDCNDFGRIFSIVLNLSESDICSPYCCKECSDQVLDCFNALLELNLAVCTTYIKRRKDVAQNATLMCSLCQTPQPSHYELKDHMMLHAVEPLAVDAANSTQVQPEFNNCVIGEADENKNIEEGELVSLPCAGAGAGATHPKARSLEEEHNYSMPRDGPEVGLCHICGELKVGRKVLTRHLNHFHYGIFDVLRSSKCSICKIIINDRVEMHKHRKEVHHLEEKLPKCLKKCRICGMAFGSLNSRNRHEEYEHYVEGFFFCPECPKKFLFYDGIVGHCQAKHQYLMSNLKDETVKIKKKKRKKDDCDSECRLNDEEELAKCFVNEMIVGSYEERV